MKIKSLLITLGAFGMGLTLASGFTASASTKYVSGVKNKNFLITKKKVVLTKTKYHRAFTLPKGTIVQAQGVNTVKGKRVMYFYIYQLNYQLRKTYIGHNENTSRNIPMTTTNFKKISVPQYLRYYTTQKTYPDGAGVNATANGNLFLGTKYPTSSDLLKTKTHRVTVTTDGYLEYYASSPVGSDINVKPTKSVKITKVSRPGVNGKTYLYTKQAVPSAIGSRVSTSGNARYVTIIKRQYKSYTTTFARENDAAATDYVEVSAGYLINNKHYFMNTAVFYPEG